MDPASDDEEAWCAARRTEVVDYLLRQGLVHGGVGEVPAWFVAPHVSLWAIQSAKWRGSVGWWAICGDLPTDYCSADGCRHPRAAAKRIAESWLAAIDATPEDARMIGSTGLAASLIPLLKVRANLLLEFVDDAGAWPG